MRYRITDIEWDIEEGDEDELALPDSAEIDAENVPTALQQLEESECTEIIRANVEAVAEELAA
jgi:hypothetical protein